MNSHIQLTLDLTGGQAEEKKVESSGSTIFFPCICCAESSRATSLATVNGVNSTRPRAFPSPPFMSLAFNLKCALLSPTLKWPWSNLGYLPGRLSIEIKCEVLRTGRIGALWKEEEHMVISGDRPLAFPGTQQQNWNALHGMPWKPCPAGIYLLIPVCLEPCARIIVIQNSHEN